MTLKPITEAPTDGPYFVVTDQMIVKEVWLNSAGDTPSPHISRGRAFATRGAANTFRERIMAREKTEKRYSMEEVLASYDFSIAALEDDRAKFAEHIAVLKEHRSKLLGAMRQAEIAALEQG